MNKDSTLIALWALGALLNSAFCDEELSRRASFDGLYDPKAKYGRFEGRATDRDRHQKLLKVSSQNKNIKFFRPGDEVRFSWKGGKNIRNCFGVVQTATKEHFTLRVAKSERCLAGEDILRRGALLQIRSKDLEDRVKGAAVFRQHLMKKRKSSFLKLNEANIFINNFGQKKIQLEADFELQKAELERQRQQAHEDLLNERNKMALLRPVLKKKIAEIDQDIHFFRIEVMPGADNPWDHGHDLGLPLARRPQTKQKKSQ